MNMSYPIIVAGMPQSGSTLLFSIILSILSKTDTIPTLWHPITNLSPEDVTTMMFMLSHQSRPVVVKVHKRNLNSEIILGHPNTKVFTTRRDLRDSVASHLRKKQQLKRVMPVCDLFFTKLGISDNATPPTLHEWRNHFINACAANSISAYRDWENRSDFEFIYEKYKGGDNEKRGSIIIEIAKLLGVNIVKETAQQILFGVEREYISLSPDHIITNKGIIGGYKNTLLDHEIKLIEKRFSLWFDDKGYERGVK